MQVYLKEKINYDHIKVRLKINTRTLILKKKNRNLPKKVILLSNICSNKNIQFEFCEFGPLKVM